MEAITVVEGFRSVRYSFFKWRYSLSLAGKFSLAFLMACLTGLLASIRVQLPFTPVPMTGQVLGVLLSGVICGALFGSISQIVYVALGIAWVPWLAGGSGYSWNLLSHPTGGYLIGFMLAPFLIGRYTERYVGKRTFLWQLKLMFLGIGIIYVSGGIVLSITMGYGIEETVAKGILPFIIVDILKAAVASGVSFSILPKVSFNGEIDRR